MNDLARWLQGHDTTIDLLTVWALCLGFALFAVVKAVSWWSLRDTEDDTDVGRSLKRQKLGEALMGAGMATLYGMTLIDYYLAGTTFGFWDRVMLRSGIFVGMVLVSIFGVQFVAALRRERHKGGPSSTT
jgi:hypothetical protein